MATWIYLPDDDGPSCPNSAPFRLLRVRPENTFFDGDGNPLPRGIWVLGYNPWAYDDLPWLAARWNPVSANWSQWQRVQFGTGTVPLAGGLIAVSATEAYFSSQGMLWAADGVSGINDIPLANDRAGWHSTRVPALAGGSDTGDFFMAYDQQDPAHQGAMRYNLEPNNLTWQYLTVSSPPLANQFYLAGTDAATILGTTFTSLFNASGPSSGPVERLYRTDRISSVVTQPVLTFRERLRIAGITDLNMWVLDSSEDSQQGFIHRYSGGWTTTTVPASVGGDSCFWRGIWAGTDHTLAHNNSIWICGVRWNFSTHTGNPIVAHRDPLTGLWDITTISLDYAMLGANGDGLQDIWALADDDIWAVGSVCSDVDAGTVRSLVVHWDGTRWSERNLPNLG